MLTEALQVRALRVTFIDFVCFAASFASKIYGLSYIINAEHDYRDSFYSRSEEDRGC